MSVCTACIHTYMHGTAATTRLHTEWSSDQSEHDHPSAVDILIAAADNRHLI